MKSCLFIENVTQLDFATFDGDGVLHGKSYTVSVRVDGEVEEKEAVVVDFSTIKKDIKGLIDDPQTGYDHKLIIQLQRGNVDVLQPRDGYIHIKTPSFFSVVPENAVKIIYEDTTLPYSIKHYLEANLKEKYKESNIKVHVFLSDDALYPKYIRNMSIGSFGYVHGLKNSSSWGCQNINHGHSSWFGIQVYDPVKGKVARDKILAYVIEAVFVWKDNIYEPEDFPIPGVDLDKSKDWVCVKYYTPRGRFLSCYDKSVYNVVVLETETTIEHLAQHLVDKFRDELKGAGATSLYVSEGLSKGAVCAV